MNEEQNNRANSWGQEYVEKYIKKSTTHGCVGYRVFIHRHDLQVNERFETLRKAIKFRDEALRLCELKRNQTVREQLKLKEYPYNLIEVLGLEVDDVILTFDERIQELHSRGILSPRVYAYLMGVYKGGVTFNELARVHGITGQRVRAIVLSGVAKLKAHRRFIQTGEFAYTERKLVIDYKAYIAEHKKEWDYESAKAFIEEYRNDETCTGSVYETPIEDLDLSIRSSNCLRRANIQTVGDLCSKTEVEMMHIRNLGIKSLREIQNKLRSINLKFRECEQE